MKPVMYLFLNREHSMSTGKSGAQLGHATVKAFRLSQPGLTAAWDEGAHETKLVMEAVDTEHLLNIERYLNDRGFSTALVIDEGRTEVAPHSATALGVEIVDKNDPHTQATFESFKTYRDEKPKETPRKRWYHRSS